MKKFLLKIIAALIIGSLTGGLIFYFWKYKYVFSKNEIPMENIISGIKDNQDIQKAASDKNISDARAAMINYVDKNINKISPEKPAKGLAWQVIKIWFIDDKNFYVDYKDEVSNTRRLLISQSVGGPSAEYEILGFFIPGDNGWKLKTGKDAEGTTFFKLYVKNEENNEWMAK